MTVAEQQQWTAWEPGSTQTSTLSAPLLSPSQLAGTASGLASVQFCWGIVDTAGAGTADISITNASVVEHTEAAVNTATVPVQPPATNADEAPGYVRTPLINDPENITSGAGCTMVQTSITPAIAPGGYLQLVLTVTVSGAPENSTATWPQATLSLGRISTTYTS